MGTGTLSILAALWMALASDGLPSGSLPTYARELGVYTENDALNAFARYGMDYNHMSRMGLYWQSLETPTGSPRAPSPAFRGWKDRGRSFLFPRSWYKWNESLTFTHGFVAAQYISCPRRIGTLYSFDPTDRPFGGWLCSALVSKVTDHRRTFQDSYEINFGVLGPQALGREVQTWFHEVIENARPRWEVQLPDEVAGLLAWDRRLMIPLGPEEDWRAYASPRLGFRLGNVHTDLALGGMLLAGWNTPRDFDAGMVSPSIFGIQADVSVYAFLGAEVRAVGFNAFLDGTLLGPSHRVPRNPIVADIIGGVTWRWGPIRLSMGQAARTPEIRGEASFIRLGFAQLSVAMNF